MIMFDHGINKNINMLCWFFENWNKRLFLCVEEGIIQG